MFVRVGLPGICCSKRSGELVVERHSDVVEPRFPKSPLASGYEVQHPALAGPLPRRCAESTKRSPPSVEDERFQRALQVRTSRPSPDSSLQQQPKEHLSSRAHRSSSRGVIRDAIRPPATLATATLCFAATLVTWLPTYFVRVLGP